MISLGATPVTGNEAGTGRRVRESSGHDCSLTPREGERKGRSFEWKCPRLMGSPRKLQQGQTT